MANKRMFTNKITGSDAFTGMPMSAQGLYFQLCMNADDDGFINNLKRIIFCLAEEDKKARAMMKDYKLLVEKRFLLEVDGVVVVKHWRMHNTISKNRYSETQYTEEKAKLLLKDNGSYSLTSGVPIDDSKLVERGEKEAQERRASGAQVAHSEASPKKTAAKKTAEPKAVTVYYPTDSVLDEAFRSYVQMRVKIKKPMTERAVELAMKELDKLSGGDADTAVAILEQSVLNSWQGLFALRDRKTNNGGVNWDNV